MNSRTNPTLICTGKRVLLPGHDVQPATMIIDLSTGKITAIQHGHTTKHDFPALGGDHVRWIDAGDKIVLPGLVEYVPALTSTECP
jgi:hypothetical protein